MIRPEEYLEVEIDPESSCDAEYSIHSSKRQKVTKSLKQNERKTLEIINAHERDKHVYFDEGPHKYEIEGSSEDVISCTTLAHRLFAPFVENEAVRATLFSPSFRSRRHYPVVLNAIRKKLEQNVQDLGMEDADLEQTAMDILQYSDLEKSPWFWVAHKAIKDYWQLAREEGTAAHLNAENYLNILPYDPETRELQHLLNFAKDYCHWQIYRTELTLYCRSLLLAGQVDALYKNLKTGRYVIVDWKRSYEIKKDSYGNRMGHHRLSQDMPDCNFSHYTFQINIYWVLAEDHLGYDIEGGYLVIFHPRQINYEIYQVPDIRSKVRELFLERKEEVQK